MDLKHLAAILLFITDFKRQYPEILLEHLNDLLKSGSISKNEKSRQLCLHTKAPCTLNHAEDENSALSEDQL